VTVCFPSNHFLLLLLLLLGAPPVDSRWPATRSTPKLASQYLWGILAFRRDPLLFDAPDDWRVDLVLISLFPPVLDDDSDSDGDERRLLVLDVKARVKPPFCCGVPSLLSPVSTIGSGSTTEVAVSPPASSSGWVDRLAPRDCDASEEASTPTTSPLVVVVVSSLSASVIANVAASASSASASVLASLSPPPSVVAVSAAGSAGAGTGPSPPSSLLPALLLPALLIIADAAVVGLAPLLVLLRDFGASLPASLQIMHLGRQL